MKLIAIVVITAVIIFLGLAFFFFNYDMVLGQGYQIYTNVGFFNASTIGYMAQTLKVGIER